MNLFFSKGKTGISYNKTSKAFQISENVFPGNESYDVNTILGLIEAKNKNYIVCSNWVSYVGKLLDARVYKMENFCYIPETDSGKDEEVLPYLKMLDDFLQRNPLYYSDQIYLTITIVSMKKKREQRQNLIYLNIQLVNIVGIIIWQNVLIQKE